MTPAKKAAPRKKTPPVAAEGADSSVVGQQVQASAPSSPLANIPLELRQLPQWVAATEDKKPINPRTGCNASVNDPTTWATFEEAVARGPHVGFVLSSNDPYLCIDIDDKQSNPATDEQFARQLKVLSESKSYVECSVGERWVDTQGRQRGGYHILLKGRMADNGRDRDHIGVYSAARFILMTGNVARPAPINEEQGLLDTLLAEMPGAAGVELEQVAGPHGDQELHQRATSAANGAKYEQLFRGEWQQLGVYPSQSEADYALLEILAFYSPDNEQVRRMFKASALGQRTKATQKYMDGALKKIRAQLQATQPTEDDIAAMRAITVSTPSLVIPADELLPPFPPQLLQLPYGLGQLQAWILSTMTYPSPATAGVTAFALLAHFAMTGIRIDSRDGLGLNEQFLVLAPSGFGKEGMRSPFAKLEAAVRAAPRGGGELPLMLPFLQYNAPASMQGMHMLLQQYNAQTFLADEFAEWLGHASKDPNKQQALGYIMQAYSKAFSTLAAPAAVTNSYKPVENPRVLIFATSTAERILETINASQADSGALNRFVIHVAEQGGIPKRYDISPQAYGVPDHLRELAAWVARQVFTVTFSTEAWQFYMHHDSRVLDPLKFSDNRLAGRLNEQAFKMAALIAISDHRQVIDVDDLRAAYAIREGLYRRAAALIANNGALSGQHVTTLALEQIQQLMARCPWVYRSQIHRQASRHFGKLSVHEQNSVVQALVRQGIAKEEGAKLVSLIYSAE